MLPVCVSVFIMVICLCAQTVILNKHLQELMDGLSAKVFRTYNASRTFQEQLDLLTDRKYSSFFSSSSFSYSSSSSSPSRKHNIEINFSVSLCLTCLESRVLLICECVSLCAQRMILSTQRCFRITARIAPSLFCVTISAPRRRTFRTRWITYSQRWWENTNDDCVLVVVL